MKSTPRNPTHRSAYIFSQHASKMSGSSNLVAMKKVVQQLRFEASINRVKAFILMLQGKVDLNTAPHAKPFYCHGISSVEHIFRKMTIYFQPQ
ncbi:hypothetical protein INR49_012895 [Caranx melampygus]|nr:hypothetical protein INR49_012895 [Caranx melampygus]